MKLTPKIVPYSSIVGSSVALHDEAGAIAAIVMVTVPRPGLNYKEVATPIIETIAAAFKTENHHSTPTTTSPEEAKVREALVQIGAQKTSNELYDEYGEDFTADFEDAYDQIISIARAALTNRPAGREGGQ
jgi:ribosomal protein S17E